MTERREKDEEELEDIGEQRKWRQITKEIKEREGGIRGER